MNNRYIELFELLLELRFCVPNPLFWEPHQRLLQDFKLLFDEGCLAGDLEVLTSLWNYVDVWLPGNRFVEEVVVWNWVKLGYVDLAMWYIGLDDSMMVLRSGVGSTSLTKGRRVSNPWNSVKVSAVDVVLWASLWYGNLKLAERMICFGGDIEGVGFSRHEGMNTWGKMKSSMSLDLKMEMSDEELKVGIEVVVKSLGLYSVLDHVGCRNVLVDLAWSSNTYVDRGFELVEWCVERGYVNWTDMVDSSTGNIKLLNLLQRAGADFNIYHGQALVNAALGNHTAAFMWLLENGVRADLSEWGVDSKEYQALQRGYVLSACSGFMA
ncbi:hypothetical protein HDU76_004948 [Blyttiomyces sp. JEL0837]|nr:hypothetical protein HDU76_004948 [Blyttiomyces sp. JEL0837]